MTVRLTRSAGQQRILLLSWLTYSLAYTLRVNIAVVIPALVGARAYTYTQMGLVTSLYFAAYMCGQLVNGYLGDRISSKVLVLTGLVCSALCNLGVALAPSYAILALCWACNGLAQSMLWAPLMKTLSVWFRGHQLERVSFIMALSMIIGYAFSWGASSILTTRLGWAWAFYVPVGLVLLQVLVLAWLFQSSPDPDPGSDAEGQTDRGSAAIQETPVPAAESQAPDRLPVLAFLKMIHLPGLLLIALTQGIIREGISIWFPTIIESSGRFTAGSPWMILILVPLINLCGIIFVRRVNLFLKSDSIRTLLFVFALATAIALLLNLLSVQWFWLVLLVMILLLSLTYGLTPVLTSLIPFQYARYKRVSLTAGLIDFSIYLGAALAGIASGWIADHHPWSRVMLLWMAAAVVGLVTAAWRYFAHRPVQEKS